MEGKTHYNIRIKGHVQGVGFRWRATREATQYGITGFVKNLSDGSVYIEAEGSGNQLIPFLDWCNRGSEYGYVEDVETTLGDLSGFSEFRIER